MPSPAPAGSAMLKQPGAAAEPRGWGTRSQVPPGRARRGWQPHGRCERDAAPGSLPGGRARESTVSTADPVALACGARPLLPGAGLARAGSLSCRSCLFPVGCAAAAPPPRGNSSAARPLRALRMERGSGLSPLLPSPPCRGSHLWPGLWLRFYGSGH